MIRKILKLIGIAIACVLVTAVISALAYRRHLQHNVAKERQITSVNGIDSLERVRIGGIDQWIQVRGQNASNPILLILHGSPGVAFMPLGNAFETPWEKRFTVVNWDQRGAGKIYGSNAKDLKIFVLGHSWGSILGLWLAHEHPEVVSAMSE